MRIALVSTSRTGVPPQKTGSVELLVALLAEALSGRGHEVTVFAPSESTVSTRVVSALPRGYTSDPDVWDWHLAEFMQLGLAYEHADEFDVIHSHVYCYALPFTRLVETPTVHTFHICPTPDFVRFCGSRPEQHYVLVSEFQRRFLPGVPVAAVVYNGIDTLSFPFMREPGSYLAYMGYFHPNKGPLEAIRLARAADLPIRLAGPESDYFREVILPEVDGSMVEYVGEVDHEGKVELLCGALATVLLSQRLEACPLVLLESMACGTPVLALDRGPVAEVVTQEVGGLYAADFDALVDEARRVGELDRATVRKFAVDRFDVTRMVDDYERVFERVVERAGAQ